MKTNLRRLFIFFAVMLCFSASAYTEDLRRIVSLSGYWKFSIGDDVQWASPTFNDSKWDQISIPGKWEDQGYNDYNGYAWYRKTFRVDELPKNTTIFLVMGRIDDADVVYLNGKQVGKSGSFPPEYETAYNRRRKYVIPAGYLKEGEENVIAVKVYDSYLEGGIVDSPVGMYIDVDNDLLAVNLSGKWKFHTGDNKAWRDVEVDDNKWDRVNVPSEWENEGYYDYDGYAWYRVKFRLPQNLNTEDLYLVLGKVDDVDHVYLNGKFIGSVYDLRKDSEYRMRGWEYNARRIYKIEEGLLISNGINSLAVRVYDGQGIGGIYEGPVGIMTSENYRRYKNKHYRSQTFWDYVFDRYIWHYED